ncbi:uncharacterized protein LOC115441370 [Manduca sexta]|uniref:Uncharacterized protein n=1 Tax=Manduca sexta TaxID=7130 RepID=A0A922CI12_MANSE|nr:uncharacterized protein LOC115441370 [Manduca sexta]KAG6446872.1 hypothetical protein O3G_MSEX004646 [Manduca sexta]
MDLIKHLFILTLFVSTVVSDLMKNIKPEFYKQNDEACKVLEKEPYFDIDQVVGKPWRIYYTWNMKLDKKCLDMNFKNATQSTIHRIWNDMYEYLEMQPNWEAATLHVTMGKARHELLLFADQGPAGSFVGVPNVVRDGNISPTRKAVPLLKFRMKLLRAGQFLLMMDCHMGVASLSARADQMPYRSEIERTAAELHLGDGFPACLNDTNKDEKFFVQ